MKNRLLVYLNDGDASAAQYAKSLKRQADELKAEVQRGESDRIIAHRLSCICDAVWALLSTDSIADDVRRRLDIVLCEALWSDVRDAARLPAMIQDALLTVELCPQIQRRSRTSYGVESDA